jgi:hypothetical protein
LEASTVTDLKDVDQVGKFAISKSTALTSSALAAMVTVEVVGLDIAVGYPEVASIFFTAHRKMGWVLAQISGSQ